MDVVQVFPSKLQKFWNALELPFLVLVSLLLQVVLIATGNRRKYSKNKWLAAALWLSYLSADSVATLALGVLSQAGGDSETVPDSKTTITVFWAPFLLMHLGGPDTITAYALADNELWSRHLLGLIGQVSVAIYVFLRSFTRADLNFIWIVIFLAGFVKYGEGYIVTLEEAINDRISSSSSPIVPNKTISNNMLLQKAYYFYGTFRKLFADLILSFQDSITSVSFFKDLHWNDAFSIVEIELGLVFDSFYTKSLLIFSETGIFLRIFSCLSTIAAFIAFLFIKKKGFPEAELIITYFLLVGAIFLELYAVLILFLSERMMIWLELDWTLRPETRVPKIVSLLQYLRIVPARKRWSNSMGQYNVLNHCIKYMPKRSKVNWFRKKLDQYRENFKQYLDRYWFWRYDAVPDHLKEQIFDKLKTRAEGGAKKYESYWKDKILLDRDMKCFDKNDEVEFDQSLLLWQIATDICYAKADQQQELGENYSRFLRATTESNWSPSR